MSTISICKGSALWLLLVTADITRKAMNKRRHTQINTHTTETLCFVKPSVNVLFYFSLNFVVLSLHTLAMFLLLQHPTLAHKHSKSHKSRHSHTHLALLAFVCTKILLRVFTKIYFTLMLFVVVLFSCLANWLSMFVKLQLQFIGHKFSFS